MTATATAPDHDAELLRFWRCGRASHGDCFTANHLTANFVAWEGQQHARTCDCWQHGVLRAIGWPTVTGLPGSPHVVFEDITLPHQVRLLFTSGSGGIAVTCTCLLRIGGTSPEKITVLAKDQISTLNVITAHRDWHIAAGQAVTAKWPEYAP